ncbi:MAG: right-handed parallel beta-helix repeat-containing protein [Bryobacteraceae bacterium]
MPNADITRYLNQPRKHYSGSRLQQGRSILDSDFNEGAEAASDDLRDSLIDVIGAAGSTNDGFLPALKVGDTVTSKLVRFGAFTQAYVLDYPLKSGSMYVGGALWEQTDSEPVIFQREFLQMGAATAPRAALGEQRQLSYLRGWEQPTTAVEDAEFLEPSLGGADAAARVRRIRRVEVRNVQSTNCAAAFAEVLEDLGNGDTATYDPATSQLQSNARLRMTFQGSPASECGPCSPSLEGRYLGSESHAIRIMLASPDHYVWAFDNAAPLYRVKLVLDGAGGAQVEMLTPPKDTYHYPRQHNVVEFLPWEALLENGKPLGGKVTGEAVKNEKVASPVGFFGEADGAYEPSARTFHVVLAPGSAFELGVGKGKADSEAIAVENLKSGTGPTQDGIALRWDEQHPLDDQLNPTDSSSEGFVAYVYMRIWHLKQPNAPLTIPASSGKAIGQTGLVPVFTGRGRPGDFWTIAVRPEAPDEILPREIMLEGGSPPHGPREVVAPVSLITWQSATGSVHHVLAIEDCRPTIVSLTERGCCTYDVGPGGDFETIQAAVDALPVSGGRLCVRAGLYSEEIRIAGKSNVVVAGCGGRTRIESPDEPASEVVVGIELEGGESNISLRDLAIDAHGQIGVRAVGGSRVECRRVNIRAMASDTAGPRSAIHVSGTTEVRITRSRIEMGAAFSDHAAVYIDAPGATLIEDNTIETRRDQDGDFSHAWGGIHVAGGSRDIEIRDNVIRGGRGHGITLGSVVFRALNGSSLGAEGAGRGQSNPQLPGAVTGIIQSVVVAGDPDTNGSTQFFPEPQPAIEELIIADNHIEGAGASGISSLALQVQLDDRTTRPPLCFRRTTFAVINLVIADNRILDNARQLTQNDGERTAFGGIVLSEAIRTTIRGNLIDGNGAGRNLPVCGICVAQGEHVSVVANRIRRNGAVVPTQPVTPLPGQGGTLGPRFQGGIVIASPDPGDVNLTGPRNIHLRRNVVDQPDAVAAFVVSQGACRITANHFHAHGQAGRILGPAVFASSAGKPSEAVDLPLGEPNPARWLQPAGSVEFLNGRAQEFPDGDGGALCFSGNQVTTNGTSNPPLGGFGAFLFSTDHIFAGGNQFAARSRERSALSHVMAIGATLDVSVNRVAETLEATEISLAAMAGMLTACAGNQLTHCLAVFGCRNHGNPDYFVMEDNLVWFLPVSGRCEEPARPVIEVLQRLCTVLFGRTPGTTSGFTILRGGNL